MTKPNTYPEAAAYLEYLFDLLNRELFESALSKPTITIQSTPKAYGHFTTDPDTWKKPDENTHEINIGAGTLARPITEVMATMVHEMVHYDNLKKGIKDTSRGGAYHNSNFRKTAEAHGLIVEEHQKYGWTITSPGPFILALARTHELGDIQLHRKEEEEHKLKKKSSTRKYTCPCCGMSVRATKTVNIICGDCDEQMITEEE